MKKRLLSGLTAFLTAAALTFPLFSSLTVSAAISSSDTADLIIKNLQQNDEVTLYKIGTAEYNSAGTIFYQFNYLDGVSLTETAPTQEEIVEIATNILNGTVNAPKVTYTWDGDNDDESYSYATMDVAGGEEGETTVNFTVKRETGVYIAIVNPASTEYVYNPLLLAVSYYYDTENKCAALASETERTVDITGKYLYGVNAVQKSTHVTLDKTAEGGVTDADENASDIMTGSVGTVLNYTISPVLPIYPQTATNKTFYVADSMTEGLTFAYNSLLVTLKNTETIRWGVTDASDITDTKNTASDTFVLNSTNNQYVTSYAKYVPAVPAVYAEDNTTVITPAVEAHWEIVENVNIAEAQKTQNGFNMTFVYDNLLYTSPVITYQAIINDSAVVGSDGNDNDAKLFYSNNPVKGGTYSDITKHPDPTDTAIAVTEVDTTVTIYTYELKFKKVDTNGNPLADAIFGVYSDENCTSLIDIIKTNADGLGYSNQISKGTYYLKEITPPDGYSLNETVYGPYEVKYKTATTKTTKASTEISYTSNKEEAYQGTEQVGWLLDGDFWKEVPSNASVVYVTEEGEETALVGYLNQEGVFSAEKKNNDFYAVYTASDENYDHILWKFMDEYFLVLPAYISNVTKTATEKETEVETDIVDEGGAGVYDINTDIPNTRLSALPSTGGSGTYILTGFGVAVFGVAVYMMFRDGKRKEDTAE